MRSIDELNDFTQKAFKKITAKESHELNGAEKAFVIARKEYLSGDLKEKFADLFEKPKTTKAKK